MLFQSGCLPSQAALNSFAKHVTSDGIDLCEDYADIEDETDIRKVIFVSGHCQSRIMEIMSAPPMGMWYLRFLQLPYVLFEGPLPYVDDDIIEWLNNVLTQMAAQSMQQLMCKYYRPTAGTWLIQFISKLSITDRHFFAF